MAHGDPGHRWSREDGGARRGASVPAVLARGEQPLDAASLDRIRTALRRGVVGVAVGGAGLACLLFALEVLAGGQRLALGAAGGGLFLVGYAVLVRGVARSYRTIPDGVPPVEVAAATLPSAVGLGVLAALSVTVPFAPERTLALLGVGVGALALVTGLALAFACLRAAVRQARPTPGHHPGRDRPAADRD